MCPPSGSPPATYDYDAAVAGTQGPKSPLLAGYQTRSLRTHQFAIPVLVPLPDLQAVLPPGFAAIAAPPGSATAQVGLAFVYQQRLEIVGLGTFGPASSLFVATTASNTARGRQESLVLAVFSSNSDLVPAFNGNFGPGSMRLSEIEIEIKESKGVLSFDASARDAGTGLQVRASASCPDPIDVRVLNDPAPLAFRFLNALNPNPAFRLASQADTVQVTATTANAKVTPAHGPLRLLGGNVTISQVGATVTFVRALEIFTKME